MKTLLETKTSGTISRTHTLPVPHALAHQKQYRQAMRRAGVQPRLEIGTVDDPLEHEADALAERVMRMPEPQGHLSNSIRQPGLNTGVQPRSKTTSPPSTPTQASPQLESSLNSLNNGGSPLDASTRAFFEPRFGQDFSQVRLHTDAPAAQMADSLNAKAFTLGNNIAFAAHQYSANSPEGKNLLGHELAHVIQQTGTLRRQEANTQNPPKPSEGPKNSIGRFSPSPGLMVDRTETSVAITGRMELYGEEANEARAKSIQDSINTTWTRTFSDGYSIRCTITVRYRPPGSKAGEVTQIEAAKIRMASHVFPALRGRSMTLNANEGDALTWTWTPAHEFGHIIGLDDRYSEPLRSQICNLWGCEREGEVQPGYEGNLMSEKNGKLESQNVADLATENEPSEYWINDDDHVRDWVAAHSSAEIGRLSTSAKLRAIQTLQGGWISGDDMVAMGQICASVSTRAEAEAIQRGVNLLVFTSIGQRSQMRVFLDNMLKNSK